MSFQVNVPPSMVAKMTKTEEMVDETSEKKKKEDWRKIKELEEARKAGTAPAMQDEEGKDINPHIPQYIMQAPWYTGAMRPTLKHQREPDERKEHYSSMEEWYIKGAQAGKVATKFREGACENCGALGHTKKFCLERPRKVGAKYSRKFAPDDCEQPNLHLSYDGKRDRWNGYDSSEHKKIVEDFQKVEEVKREMKAKKLETSLLDEKHGDEGPDDDEDEDEDDDKYADDIAMPGQKFETKQRITVRNLRIREDTAKYLYNLDVNSAFYDPKTRAMRANPFDGNGVDAKELPYAGDNFVRWSGEASDTIKKQMFAWEAYSKGTDVNVQADPTKLELLHREYQKKKETYKEKAKGSILEKYGGQEHLDAPPIEFLLGQNEEYVEYSRHGTLVKGNKKRVVKSKYEEDVLEKNHTAVWGSYWEAGRWGYNCCHSLVRGSYCIGEAGLKENILNNKESQEADAEVVPKKATEIEPVKSIIDSNSLLHQHLERIQADEKKRREEKKKHKSKKRKHNKHETSDESSDSDEDDDDEPTSRKTKNGNDSKEDKKQKKKKHKHKKKKLRETSDDEEYEKKLKKAIKKEKLRQMDVDKMLEKGDKDCPYNVMYDSKGPTEEEVEAYQRLRMRADDPMASYFSKKDL